MSEIKPYEDQDSEPQSVNEAGMIYETSCRSVDDFIASVPVDLMQKLVEYAIEECKAGRCIPHEQVQGLIKKRMGWK